VLSGKPIEIDRAHAASLWVYVLGHGETTINGREEVCTPVSGFKLADQERSLGLLPLPLRNRDGTLISVNGQKTLVHWREAPERPPSQLDPQTESELLAHGLMLRAEAVWNRLKDVETALKDPASLWPELGRRWATDGEYVAPQMDIIVQHAFRLWRTIEELAQSPRRVLRRTHHHLPVSRVQELDRRSMTWLVRQPGETLAERAGNQQRILAVARDENFDTLENRVLRTYCEQAWYAARDYLELNKSKRFTNRPRKVDAFARATRRLARHLGEQGVRFVDPGVTPNFVLQHNVNYHRIWSAWQDLLARERVLDDLWRWQSRSWEEFCALAVVVALAGLPDAKLVAAAPLAFLREQNRGSWVAHDNPLAVYYLPNRRLIVEVRFRMAKPDKRLADFAAPILVRYGLAGDYLGFLKNVVVWPVWAICGGLIDSERADLERIVVNGRGANVVAAAIIRPSADESRPSDVEGSKAGLCLTLGTEGIALKSALASLTDLFTATVTEAVF